MGNLGIVGVGLMDNLCRQDIIGNVVVCTVLKVISSHQRTMNGLSKIELMHRDEWARS